jgi:hypothetical protein
VWAGYGPAFVRRITVESLYDGLMGHGNHDCDVDVDVDDDVILHKLSVATASYQVIK